MFTIWHRVITTKLFMYKAYALLKRIKDQTPRNYFNWIKSFNSFLMLVARFSRNSQYPETQQTKKVGHMNSLIVTIVHFKLF